jgi:Ca-activated chloride channel homolog
MNFEHTVWLYITPAIVLIAAGMIAFGLRRREALLGKFAATRLLGQLTEKASHTRTLLKALCLLIGLAALGIALARPQYGVEWSERKARGLDIVFVLDSSKSMLATDMRPTRLDRAKLAVIDLTERLESDRIGLVAFAGRAFLQTPPTLDYSAFRESLDSIGPETMTSGGSDLGNALKEAEKAFPKDNNFKVIVLLTDGEDLGGTAIETAKTAAGNGIKVYAIGIGTPEGEYLRIRNAEGKEEFIRDAQGQPVRSQLDEATLQQIAQVTGGTYSRLSSESLNSLYNSVIATLPREEREAELQESPIERFQWVLAAAIFFLVLEILIRRRGNVSIHAALLLAALLTVTPTDTQAQAVETPIPDITIEATEPETEISKDARINYNQAYEALTAGELEKAQKLYQNSIAHTADLQLQRDALYNLGHSTYQTSRQTYDSGDLPAAIEQIKEAEALFQSAIEVDPNDQAAVEDLEKVKAVREAMEAIQEQQQEQNQENQDESEDSEENQDDSEQDQQESDDSQSSEEQNQEQQDSENGEDQESQDQQNQDQQDGENSEQGEQQDSQQGENSENQESSEQQSSEQGNEGEPSEDEQNQSGASEEESTEDPVDDIPQPQPGEEESEDAGEQGEAPQPTEGEPSEEEAAGAQAGGQAMQVEGMSQEDATALLESLRNGEKLLPFIDQNAPRNRGEVRDW